MTSQQNLDAQNALDTQEPRHQNLRIRIVKEDSAVTSRKWSEDAQALIAGSGTWRLIGSAGSGVSSLLIDTALARLDSGVPIDKILIVSSSKKAAFRLRRDFSRRLKGNTTMTTPVVRSVTSLAFWLLQKLADEKFGLLPGAQFDAIIQELLRGDLRDQHDNWPEDLHLALPTVSFARELKDFLLQVVQRGVSAAELEEIGRDCKEPRWTSAGKFLGQVQEVMSLQDSEPDTVHQYLEAELSGAAVRAWNKAIETGGFSSEEGELPFDTILIDDAQHLNPRGAELLSYLIAEANKVVIAGDPDQSVFRFRGAYNNFLLNTHVDHELRLTESFRKPHPQLVKVLSGSAQRNLTVDFIRRAHLLEGTPWKDMAVIVRSAQDIPGIQRALNASGVPVHLESANLLLTEQPLVANLLLALKSVVSPLTRSELEKMASGLVADVDQAAFRRIYRVLEHYVDSKKEVEAPASADDVDDSLASQEGASPAAEDFHERIRLQGDLRTQRVAVLTDLLQSHEAISEDLKTAFEKANCLKDLKALETLKEILDAGYSAYAQKKPLDLVLWDIWTKLGLATPLQDAALRGGVRGAQAQKDLNAVIDLFDALADFLKLKPEARVNDFINHITSQDLPTGVRDRRQGEPDAVTVITAHGAVDGEWKNVVIAGVQSNQWPRPYRGDTVFQENKFLDFIDDKVETTILIDRAIEATAEERRLLHVATTRATDKLLVIGVDSELEETMPSRLFYELEDSLNTPINEDAPLGDADIRVLDSTSLIAELRRVVTNEDAPLAERQHAAHQLARLASAGFTAANPEEWWSTKELSTDAPLEVKNLSPSKIGNIFECPLGAVADRLLPTETNIKLQTGTLIHLYAEALESDWEEQEVRKQILDVYRLISHPAVWKKEVDYQEFEAALDNTKEWIEGSRNDKYEKIVVEGSVEATLPNGVKLRGTIDRLEKTSKENDSAENTSYRIVDYKSGNIKYASGKILQLAAYDSAVRNGKLSQDGKAISIEPTLSNIENPVLVYPKSSAEGAVYGQKNFEYRADVTNQEQRENFEKLIGLLWNDAQGSRMVARNYDKYSYQCRNCPLWSVCPLRNENK